MPSEDTFSILPIAKFVGRWTGGDITIVDPFARNSTIGTYTNDLNPNTTAAHHLPAIDFLKMLFDEGIVADVVIFDPPYSLRQAKEVYDEYGKWEFSDTQRVGIWQDEKHFADRILSLGGIFLHFGWHTNGMGIGRSYRIEEILIVAHGRAHNDTLCMAERKMQANLL